jgi:transcriptional regulator GlxA family with amidase domain
MSSPSQLLDRPRPGKGTAVHQVTVLVLPGVVAFNLGIPAQVFSGSGKLRYSTVVCAERPGPVVSSSGFTVQVEAGLEALASADTIVVPGCLPPATGSATVRAAVKAAALRGTRIASICTGAFTLAAAGLLDGRAATTNSLLADDFVRRFPNTRFQRDALYVDEGQILTSAGVAAGVDLCLHMLATDHGAPVAADVAQAMVTRFLRPGGQDPVKRQPIAGCANELAGSREWAISQISQPVTVGQLAAEAGWAPRTFARRFLAETGMTPMRWLTAQRLAEARRLLELTDLTVETIAHRCGLGTAANLRLHLARDSETTPTAYRRASRAAAGLSAS